MNIDPIQLEILLNSGMVSTQTESINRSLRGMDQYIATAERGFERLTASQSRGIPVANQLASSFRGLTSAAAAYFTLNSASGLVSQLIEVRGEFQKTEVAYTTMLGSAEKAQELMRESSQLAIKSPFSMSEVASGAKQLLAFNVPANEVIDTLRRMGDISAGLGVPMSRLQLVFGQVRAKGKLMGDDLRQFTEAGVPLVEGLSKKFKVTTAEIYAMVSAGSIGFNDVKEVLFAMTNEGGKFYNLMSETSKTLSGQYSNLKDAVERAFNEMGQSSENFLASGLAGATALVEHYDDILRVLGGVVTTYGAYKTALMLVLAIENTRNKTLASEIANLSASERIKLQRLLVTQRQAQASLQEVQAEQTATEAKYQSLQAEVAILEIKKNKALALAQEKAQIVSNAQSQLVAAQAELSALGTTATARQVSLATKKVEQAQNKLLATQETASIARKNALATSSQFYTQKQNLETTATALNTASKKTQTAQEALNVATKNVSTAAEQRLTIAQTLRASATQLVTKAQALLNTTMLSNPIVLIVAAVSGLVYAYISLRDTTTAAQKAEKTFNEEREKSREYIEEMTSKTQKLISIINDETASKLQQLEAYQELQTLYPALYKNMDIETFKKQSATVVQKQLNEATDQYSTQKLRNEAGQAQGEINRLKAHIEELYKTLGDERTALMNLNKIDEANDKITEQEALLERINDELKKRLENEKIAQMTTEERLKYYQDERYRLEQNIRKINEQTQETKKGNEQVQFMLTNVQKTGDGLLNWNIDKLKSQISFVNEKIKSIQQSLAPDTPTVKNKTYWETQKNNAQKAIDEMSTAQRGSKAWNEQKALVQEAEAQLKLYNVSAEQTIKQQKKLATETQKLADKRKNFIKEIAQAEWEFAINQMQSHAREVAQIEDKYQKMREQAQALKLDASQVKRIDRLEQSELYSLQQKQDNEQFFKDLELMKDAYAAYEALKTQIGKEEAQNRYASLLGEFENYSAVLQSEIDKLRAMGDQLTPEGKDKLGKLEQLQSQNQQNTDQKAEQKYAEAFTALMSFDEKRRAIEQKYQEDKAQLELITNQSLREAKISELEFQKTAALDALNNEIYQRETLMERLSQNLVGITRRELNSRIAALEEYLDKVGSSLGEEQRQFVESELAKARAIQSSTDIGTEEKALLQEKERLMARISQKQSKGIGDVQDEVEQLAAVNVQLKDILAKKFARISEVAGQLGGSFQELGSSLKDYDEGLGDTVETMGELLNIAGEVSGAVASFASGDIVGGITKTIKAITSIFSLGTKARESEKKAQEEIKKYHQEIYQAQLDYNAELRKRLADEVKINDLYKSRVSNIREEMQANRQNVQQAKKEQQELFQKLLNAQTTVDKQTEKYGGFLGIGRKTRVKDINKSVAELLGIGKYVQKQFGTGAFSFGVQVFEAGQVELTDEIFEKLEKLNAEKPLTGDAKTAYEQLKKLREEYGSLEEAQLEYQKQLNEALAGSTADSLADSIKQGIASGKKSFADFADDIEEFLRNAVLAGLETDLFKERTQKLHEALATMMTDGTITNEEREQFNQMYMAIVEETKTKMELLNQAGLNIVKNQTSANSLQGAIEGMSQESADILAGHFSGLRLSVKDIASMMKNQNQNAMEKLSQMIEVQMNIERHTRRTAENTDKLHAIDEGIGKMEKAIKTNSNAVKASGF